MRWKNSKESLRRNSIKMIKIQRGDCPPVLSKSDNEFVKSDYNKPDVLSTLLEMQYRKCCYCERDIGSLPKTEREVDHFIPKSVYKDNNGNIQWHLANKWENLLYACRSCNGRKSDANPFNQTTGEQEIINPSGEINPEDHIGFITDDDTIVNFKEKNGSRIGRSTIEKLKLFSRHDLVQGFRIRKVEIDKEFTNLINFIESENNNMIQSCIHELKKVMSAHTPFAAFNRAYIKERLRKLNERQILKIESEHKRTFQRIDITFPVGCELVA